MQHSREVVILVLVVPIGTKLPEKNKLKLESQFDAHARLSESNAAIWFKTAFAPIEKVLNSAAFKNTKSTSLNVL